MRLKFYILLTTAFVCAQCGTATEIIEIIKPGAIKSAIDLSGLSVRQNETAIAFKKVLQADLERSGWFAISRPGYAAFAVAGSCEETATSLEVKCHVYNTGTEKTYLSKSFVKARGESRRLAHMIADEIVLALKGRPGIASTRIVMVGALTGAKELYVCDSDGYDLTQMTHDNAISVAPAWSADGNALVYTSFRTAFPYVYMIDLLANPPRRDRITSFPGLNVCAAISHDGRKMALSLSKDGNPDLYIMDLRSRQLTRITRTRHAAEASPSWSPDDRQIVFVSDGPGRPHLYVADRDGTRPRRITFQGTENVAPDWGPNGLIAYSSKRGGLYQICVINPTTEENKQLTNDPADHEDPSWAPDGRHIAYERKENYHSDIYILDTMGDTSIRLTGKKSDWYSPAWSPK